MQKRSRWIWVASVLIRCAMGRLVPCGYLTGSWRLVPFHGAVKQSWLDRLQAAGLEPVQYIRPYTYVVWAEPLAMAMARSAALYEVCW